MKQAESRKPSSAFASGTDAKATMRIMRAALPADKGSVTLEMVPGSGASGKVTLTANGLATLIKGLGQVHAAMVQDRPIPPFEGQEIAAILNPRWQVGPGLMGEASAFAFHHPGYGPLGFVVPIEQVETMVEVLSKHVASAKATKSGTRN